MPNALETPWVTLEVNDIPFSLCNDLGRPSLRMISWSRFFFFFNHLLSLLCNAGDLGLIPGLGRSPGEGKGYQLQYSGLENSMDCIVYGVRKSQTRLSDFHFQPSQSRWDSLQSILWMYLSWLIGIYTLEKLASVWNPSASPLLGRSHVIAGISQLGSSRSLGVI